ncbi:MAG: ABC transporter ATP-binding protein [Janthinobacterium lividum]
MVNLSLEQVALDLPIFDATSRSLKKKLMRLIRRSPEDARMYGVTLVHALSDVNVALVPGDRLGLIGPNGAGKSTLLRVMAGIYPPTGGTIQRTGRAVALLDIALGMDENSSGRQNIRLRGLLLGMSEHEIREKEEEIVAFADLGPAIDLPLRTYSSGMRVRIAFAVSTAVDADILLLDEVMGVGDAAFKNKANKRLTDLHDRAKIVVLAIHSNDTIRETCNKALWMDGGRVRGFGPVEDVLSAYEQSVSLG